MAGECGPTKEKDQECVHKMCPPKNVASPVEVTIEAFALMHLPDLPDMHLSDLPGANPLN